MGGGGGYSGHIQLFDYKPPLDFEAVCFAKKGCVDLSEYGTNKLTPDR